MFTSSVTKMCVQIIRLAPILLTVVFQPSGLIQKDPEYHSFSGLQLRRQTRKWAKIYVLYCYDGVLACAPSEHKYWISSCYMLMRAAWTEWGYMWIHGPKPSSTNVLSPEEVGLRDAKRPFFTCGPWEVKRPSWRTLGNPKSVTYGMLKVIVARC